METWKGKDGLLDVFNPMEKPWIKPNAASTERIIEQITKCPSGALSFYYNEDANPPEEVVTNTKVEVMENGPLLVYGNLTVTHKNGEIENKNKVTAFCRCGQSSNKPYCDGSHITSGFQE